MGLTVLQLSGAQAGSYLGDISHPLYHTQQDAKWCNAVINQRKSLTFNIISLTPQMVCLFISKRFTEPQLPYKAPCKAPREQCKAGPMELTVQPTNKAQVSVQCAEVRNEGNEKYYGEGWLIFPKKKMWYLIGDLEDELGFNDHRKRKSRCFRRADTVGQAMAVGHREQWEECECEAASH